MSFGKSVILQYQFKQNNQISLTPEEETTGFVSLSNGKDLTGWVGNMTDYKVVDQTILIDPTAGGKGYADFEMWVDWRISKNGDSGFIVTGKQIGRAHV